MSGGAPIPVPSGQPKGQVILSIDDLDKAGSSKLPTMIRGMCVRAATGLPRQSSSISISDDADPAAR